MKLFRECGNLAAEVSLIRGRRRVDNFLLKHGDSLLVQSDLLIFHQDDALELLQMLMDQVSWGCTGDSREGRKGWETTYTLGRCEHW